MSDTPSGALACEIAPRLELDGHRHHPAAHFDDDGKIDEAGVEMLDSWPEIEDEEFEELVADVRTMILQRFGVDVDGDSPIGFSLWRRGVAFASVVPVGHDGYDSDAACARDVARITRAIEHLSKTANSLLDFRESRHRHSARKAERQGDGALSVAEVTTEGPQ